MITDRIVEVIFIETVINIVYSNKEMLSTLGVSDKLLIQYRNDGVLPYRRMDDKYWYTQEDLDYFMNTHKVGVPFAS